MPTVPPITQNFSRPSYRPEAQSGMDPDMKRMALAAAGLGGLVALVIGAVSLAPHARHGVPVLEPVGPVRVKPADPGGMTVAGSDDGAGGVEALAPAAEKPAIRALRAKSRAAAARPAQGVQARTASIPAAQQAGQQAKAAPAPAASLAAAPPVRASATQAMAASGAMPHRVSVQLAAFDNQQSAEQDWGKLAERMPGMFDGHRPEVMRAQIAGRVVYRLRTGGFATAEEAGAFCGKLRAKGGDCSVTAS